VGHPQNHGLELLGREYHQLVGVVTAGEQRQQCQCQQAPPQAHPTARSTTRKMCLAGMANGLTPPPPPWPRTVVAWSEAGCSQSRTSRGKGS
jgi:hypothetical protein